MLRANKDLRYTVKDSKVIVGHPYKSLVTKRHDSTAVQVNLPVAYTSLSSSSKKKIAHWVPSKRVIVGTHSVKYRSGNLDMKVINATEYGAFDSFVKENRGSDDELLVMVGGEDTHPGLGDLYDLTNRINFWKSAVKKKCPAIVQTSANYFQVGDQYANCAIIADFIRGTVHLLVKGSVANPIDRFCAAKGYPEDTMCLGGPRVFRFGPLQIGHAICLDTHHLADLMSNEPGIYNIAILSSFGDPSSDSLFPKNTLKIVQDHRWPFGKGGSVTQVGRHPQGFWDTLYLMFMAEPSESGVEYRSSTQITPEVSKDEDELVFNVAPSGEVAASRKLQSTSSKEWLSQSRLNVYPPVMLKMYEYWPASPQMWERWKDALKKIAE